MYFKTCPICGSNNDPGEHCECERKITKKYQEIATIRQDNEKMKCEKNCLETLKKK